MGFPFVPQAWLHSGLLLLTLMLVAVCGTQMEKNQSTEAQPTTPIEEMQGDTEVGEQQRSNTGNTVNNETSEMDLCNMWVNYYEDFYTKYSGSLQRELPNCPCNFHVEPTVEECNPKFVGMFDELQDRNFHWRDIPKPKEDDENVYHPSAGRCIRSLPKNINSVVSQLCCYDSFGGLITRGKDAGFPQLISPDFSSELHLLVDSGPWNFCKGNWHIFHKLLPPNNGLNCFQNPSNDVYEAQLRELSAN